MFSEGADGLSHLGVEAVLRRPRGRVDHAVETHELVYVDCSHCSPPGRRCHVDHAIAAVFHRHGSSNVFLSDSRHSTLRTCSVQAWARASVARVSGRAKTGIRCATRQGDPSAESPGAHTRSRRSRGSRPPSLEHPGAISTSNRPPLPTIRERPRFGEGHDRGRGATRPGRLTTRSCRGRRMPNGRARDGGGFRTRPWTTPRKGGSE